MAFQHGNGGTTNDKNLHMTDEARMQQRMERIAELVRRLDSNGGEEKRQSKELMELVMNLHGEAIERICDRLRAGGEDGQKLLESLAADPVIASVLLLYGLHPLDLETRINRAIEKVRPVVLSYGGQLELVACQHGVVRVRVSGVENAHAARAARSAVEADLYAAAPDAASLTILGLEKFTSPDFVPLEQLGAMTAGHTGG
jgi:Fe-S cluster biogenesis protein NfuA